eukprot:TRINITY_DN58977_c0_g1_i1.p1 TRINITY_DN58977_c0_g1~~TRINITY_DN58977_c0_g1_i1.p1  ORF type:complete len:135 (-),score=27.71 TRINITY_DN58977_c0_g1_i1:72-476(-)
MGTRQRGVFLSILAVEIWEALDLLKPVSAAPTHGKSCLDISTKQWVRGPFDKATDGFVELTDDLECVENTCLNDSTEPTRLWTITDLQAQVQPKSGETPHPASGQGGIAGSMEATLLSSLASFAIVVAIFAIMA